MISIPQPDFKVLMVQWKTTVYDKYDPYQQASFHWRWLLPSVFKIILHFIWNNQLNWELYPTILYTYDIDEPISAEDN